MLPMTTRSLESLRISLCLYNLVNFEFIFVVFTGVCHCSNFVCAAVVKRSDPKPLGEERVCVTCSSRSQSTIERSQSKNTEAQRDCFLLAGILACSASFIIYSRPTCLGMVFIIVGWSLPHQSIIMTFSRDMARSLSNEASFSGDSSLCQVDSWT